MTTILLTFGLTFALPKNRDACRRQLQGFTLVEMLVVLLIFLILAAITLPNLRQLLSDQKVGRGASGVVSFIDLARSRAIAEGRPVGVRIERLGPTPDGLATSLRVRLITGVPAYSGEANDSVATLLDADSAIPGVDSVVMEQVDSQLLVLSASLISDPDASSPIKIGDLLELPGGRTVPIGAITLNPGDPMVIPPILPTVTLSFDLRNALPADGASTRSTFEFPAAGNRALGAGQQFRYRIHRSPTVSSTSPFDLPRGVAVDLNYSGMGVSGNQFAPQGSSPGPLDIIFGVDGKVESVTLPGSTNPILPTGLIFLCMGDTDGVRSDNLFAQETDADANLLDLDSLWVVINPSTGRTSVSPFASVTTIPASAPLITDPTDSSLDVSLQQARSLAIFSDTVDLN